MTQNEFTARTGYEPSYDEFWRIHDEYMNFSGDKDEFCRQWRRKNLWRIKEGELKLFKSERETEEFVVKCARTGVTFQVCGRLAVRVF